MIFISCGDCGGKYQLIEGKTENPVCPSCGSILPEKIRSPLSVLVEECRNRPNWKLFLDMGNMFNIELTLKSKPEK